MPNNVKGNISALKFELGIDATPDYTDGDVLDGVQTLSAAAIFGLHAGKIVGAVINNSAALEIDIDLHFFDQPLSNSTITDNAAFDLAVGDKEKYIGTIEMRKHKTFTSVSVSLPDVNQRDLPFELGVDSAGKRSVDLYVLPQVKAAFNADAATNLDITVYIEHPG